MDRVVFDIPVGRLVDGSSWTLRLIEHRGDQPGPATAVLGGMYGDKAMSCLALHELDRALAAGDLSGTVVLAPAVNLPGLSIASRMNPDHLALNRRFPGSPDGYLTDQFAAAITREVLNRVDCIVDLHSGTPTMALWYSYDYGDLELSAAFGYLPVATGFAHPGQFGTHARSRGIGLVLPEWGGGPLTSLEVGVAGTLNVLRFRGHLPGPATGPATVPLIEGRELLLVSHPGVLESAVLASSVGSTVEPGLLGWVTNVVTGERVQEFRTTKGGFLMMATVAPSVVQSGDFAFMVGQSTTELTVPHADRRNGGHT